MKIIPLTLGQSAVVDDEDFYKVSQYPWHVKWYAIQKVWHAVHRFYENGRKGPRHDVKLHRFIMNAKAGEIVDHKDHNTLNNCKSNLRICSHIENMRNRKGPIVSSKTGYRGVFLRENSKSWQSAIRINRKLIYLGTFNDKLEAAEAYANANRLHFGEFGGGLTGIGPIQEIKTGGSQ